jgi:prophage tail gpP-like protein
MNNILSHYTNIISIKKSGERVRAGYIARMGEAINRCKHSVGIKGRDHVDGLRVGGKLVMLTWILEK